MRCCARILTITYFMLDGYSHATETLVGRAVGAKDRPRLDLCVRSPPSRPAITGIAFIGVVLWFTAGPTIAFMTTNTDVQAQLQRISPGSRGYR